MDSLTPSESTKVLSLDLFATMGFHHRVLRAFLISQNLEEDWTLTLSSKRLHREGNKLFTKSQSLFFCYEIFGPCFQKKFLEFEQTNWQKRVSIRDKNTVEQHSIHTCKKREIPEIYLLNFFWIFRKILGWERKINTAPKPSPEVAPSKMEVAPS